MSILSLNVNLKRLIEIFWRMRGIKERLNMNASAVRRFVSVWALIFCNSSDVGRDIRHELSADSERVGSRTEMADTSSF